MNEIQGLLADLQRRYPGRPDLERRALLMVGLQREQVVAVAYREDAVAGLVASLPLDEGVRQLVHQTLIWIWKDEEVHTTYLRGYLLQAGRRLPAVLIFARQIYGAISGWVTATRELTTTAEAPLRSTFSRVLIAGAQLMGLVPPAVARALGYRSFRHYCLLNAVLERTAELAYRRLEELADGEAERQLFGRIGDDEGRHGEAFELLAGILDDHDDPVPGFDGDDLERRLASISPWYIPSARRERSRAGARQAFGLASPVTVGVRASPSDVDDVVAEVLDGAGTPALIPSGGRVAVRASFMLGYDSRDRSNVTSPEVLAAIARYVLDRGARSVDVVEAPTVYQRYYQHRSVSEVADYFGFCSEYYRVVDAGADQVPFAYQRGLQQNTISRTWMEADTRLVVAKLRSDPNEFGHLCLSSLEGMASQIADTIYTGRSIDFRTATMMLLDVAPPDVAVVDAWGPLADGPVGVMGCRRPARAWRLYGGRDPLSVDRGGPR